VRPTAFALVTVASLALALPAFGKDKDDRGHGHGRGGGPPDRVVVVPAPVAPARVVFTDRDRAVVYNYYRTQYVSVGRCPPGLAKKGYGCVPPGQVVVAPTRVWVIGQPLPPTVAYQPLPPPLAAQLPPPPPPYSYVQVDNDVLLMNTSNRVIADMITDLSDFD